MSTRFSLPAGCSLPRALELLSTQRLLPPRAEDRQELKRLSRGKRLWMEERDVEKPFQPEEADYTRDFARLTGL